MSRNFAVLGKAPAAPVFSEPPADEPVYAAAPSGEYGEVIRLLFELPAAVAILGSSRVAEDLGAELAACGKRVVIVAVNELLRMNPIPVPDETALRPGRAPQVWVWPAPVGQKIEFFRSRETTFEKVAGAENWLDSLRGRFDAVLLDCPNVEEAPGVSEAAAMADCALLAVEAGYTLKEQVQKDQRALQLRGARVAGCVLVKSN